MADNLDAPTRRRTMASVPSQNTSLELQVRRAVHAAGFRFSLQRRDLPGRPDLVFPRYRLAVFVHGCFWHGHDCARGARKPQTNQQYWANKIARNTARDTAAQAQLKKLGWKSRIIWGCAVEKGLQALLKELNQLRAS